MSISNFKRVHVKKSKRWCISVYEYLFLSLRTVQTLMKCRMMRHFIWVFTVLPISVCRYPEWKGVKSESFISYIVIIIIIFTALFTTTVFVPILSYVKLNFCCNEFNFKLNWYYCANTYDVVKNCVVIKSVVVKRVVLVVEVIVVVLKKHLNHTVEPV